MSCPSLGPCFFPVGLLLFLNLKHLRGCIWCIIDRRGEEHSFILKPATSMWRHGKGHSDGNPRLSRVSAASAASSLPHLNSGAKNNGSPTDQFAVLVSCRCNYTGILMYNLIMFDNNSSEEKLMFMLFLFCRLHFVESKLFFKQPTSWRPRISRDLMISVASEMSGQALGSDGTQLPVQVIHEINFVPLFFNPFYLF